MNSIGDRLKAERERLTLNQTAFGEIGGVKKLAQINYENGSRSPDAAYLAAIASAGADVLFIVTGERHENIATTSYELAFLRNCRAFKDNEGRKMALNALVAMSGYKPDIDKNKDCYSAANDQQHLIAAEPVAEYKVGDE